MSLQAVPELDGQGEAEALRVLLLKCRDRDAAVREAAYVLLASLPARTLHALLLPSDWRCVLDCGLGVWAEPCPPGLAKLFLVLTPASSPEVLCSLGFPSLGCDLLTCAAWDIKMCGMACCGCR